MKKVKCIILDVSDLRDKNEVIENVNHRSFLVDSSYSIRNNDIVIYISNDLRTKILKNRYGAYDNGVISVAVNDIVDDGSNDNKKNMIDEFEVKLKSIIKWYHFNLNKKINEYLSDIRKKYYK